MRNATDVSLSQQILEFYLRIVESYSSDLKLSSQFVKAGLLCLESSPNDKIFELIGHVVDVPQEVTSSLLYRLSIVS